MTLRSARPARAGPHHATSEEGVPRPPHSRERARPRAAGAPDGGALDAPPEADEGAFRYRLRPEPAHEYVSPQVAALLGYAPEEFYADPWLAFVLVHPDDLPLLLRLGP